MKTVLDNSNIVESYPGITLPLTTSFIEEAYCGVFRGAVMRLTGSSAIVDGLDDDLHKMVVNHEGRIYYNLNNWYSVIAIFPFSNTIIKIWQKMLGVQDKNPQFNKVKMSPVKKISVLKNILRSSNTVPEEMEDLAKYFTKVEKDFRDIDLSKLTNKELCELYSDIKNKLLDRWEVTLANDMYAFFYTYKAEKNINGAKEFISNITNLESIKPVRELVKLAETAVKQNETTKLSRINTNAKANEYLKQNSIFAQEITKYIDNYGDRYLEELKLESDTYRTSPLLLIKKTVEFSNNIERSKKLLGKQKPVLPKTSRKNQRHIEKAVLGIKNREISRLNRSRLYGMVRAIFVQLGVNYHKDGKLADPKDIFWLSLEEALNNDTKNMKRLVNERKKNYARYEKSRPANRIIIEDGKINNIVDARSSQLVGTPVSSGKTTARVLVVDDPKTINSVNGEILVTKTTDPGWAFLMVNASGIIAERGSLLSHTAIVSRELGIPAIVGVVDATTLLKTGDIVEMNSETGKVEVKNAKK